MKTYVVTGSASGIGAELVRRIKKQSNIVISVDRENADVVADLSTLDGRESAIENVRKLAPQGIDGFIPCAGLGPNFNTPASSILSVNFFAVIEMVNGLLDLISKKSGRVVLISSNSVAKTEINADLKRLLLDDYDEAAALKLANINALTAYGTSKACVSYWMRLNVRILSENGVNINAVAPGPTSTPMLDDLRTEDMMRQAIDGYKGPLGRFAEPEDQCDVIDFLLSPQARFVNGVTIFVDGGADAETRPYIV